MVKEWWPDDSDGDLRKIEVWWLTPDLGGVSCGNYSFDPLFLNAMRGSVKNLARYRWTLPKRAAKGSPNDFSNIFALVDAMNSTGPAYTANVENLVDVEQWMRIFALEHIIGDTDSYSLVADHNMYSYKPEHGKWQMMVYDLDYSFNGNPAGDLFAVAYDGQGSGMMQHPPFKRAYLRALLDAANGPLLASNIDPFLDANYYALSVTNGLGSDELSPNSATIGGYSLKSYFSTCRNNILNNYINPIASTPLAVTSPANNANVVSNLLVMTGTAPIAVKTIKINGIEYPVTWTSVTQWTLTLALSAGANSLVLQGYNNAGNAVPGAIVTNTVNCTGTVALTEESLVINEIMYKPPVSGAEFIEIYNRSTNTAFNLANYRLNGADFTFQRGVVIAPGGFLVLVKNRTTFGQTYGFGIPVGG